MGEMWLLETNVAVQYNYQTLISSHTVKGKHSSLTMQDGKTSICCVIM